MKHASSTSIEILFFQNTSSVIVIGATHDSGLLDPALLRSGRFDIHLRLRPPEKMDRLKLLNYFLSTVKHRPLSATEAKDFLRRTVGMTGELWMVCEQINNSIILITFSKLGFAAVLKCFRYQVRPINMSPAFKICSSFASIIICFLNPLCYLASYDKMRSAT